MPRMPTLLPSLQFLAHQTAKDKGWWDQTRSFGEQIALMHSELSEALEEHRAGRAMTEVYFKQNEDGSLSAKPEGVPIELADLFIRLLDTCEHYGIDLETVTHLKMSYNATRPHRHGGKLL